jgi:hypothetical protein
MGSALELLNGLKGFDAEKTARAVIADNAELYVQANRRQMMEGKGKDRNIGRYRNSAYAQFKNSISPTAGLGNVDLRLTGKFQDSMKMTVSGDDINIEAESQKDTGDLIEKYGGQVYGLNVKNQQTYNEEIFLPLFGAELEKQTGLKLG